MALVLREIGSLYSYAFRELADPRVENWLFMKSPIPSVAIVAVWLLFVFEIGPNFMKDKKPFNLDNIMIGYNAIQICACLYTVIQGTRHALLHYDWRCAPVDFSYEETPIKVAGIMWFYYMTKLVDLLDTIFFVLRKKDNQLSFLHIYHHGGMVLLTWMYTKFLPGGQNMYTVVVNSFVHVVMYSYYLLSAWDPEYKKSIWWKKHITQLQLTQFGILCSMHLQLTFFQPTCSFPKWTFLIMMPQHIIMFILFGDFYYKAYVRPNLTKTKPVADIADGVKTVSPM